MMSRQDPIQNRLFGAPRDLGCMVPADHLLRKISEVIDFDFVYDEVEHLYSDVGRPSVPPPVLMKLMVILFLYDVRSERELMDTIPYRVDWLWFLGYDLGAKVPDHSVLSKARARWGVDLFLTVFELVVTKCVGAGLVDGKRLLCDSSLVDANASINSLFQVEAIAKAQLDKLDETEQSTEPPAEEAEEPEEPREDSKRPSSRRVSRTDPDAVGVKRGFQKTRPRYQTHRGIDNEHGVITATTVGPSDENEASRFFELVEQHESLTGEKVTTGVADKKYGTVNHLLGCLDSGITAYIRPAGDVRRSDRKGMFHSCEFVYSIEKDEYTCPAGQTLT
jgi:transposase